MLFILIVNLLVSIPCTNGGECFAADLAGDLKVSLVALQMIVQVALLHGLVTDVTLNIGFAVKMLLLFVLNQSCL